MNRRRVAIIVAAIIVAGLLIFTLARTAGGPPPVNILLITLDTTRADRIACYGYNQAMTPALDQLAAEGVLFEQAFAAVPLTLPSHATMLTGRQPPEHGLRINGTNQLGDTVPTLADLLRRQGYQTAAFIAAFALDSTFGLDRGFDVYNDDLTGAYESDPDDLFAEYRPGNKVTDDALAWLRQREDRPFFCWVHLYDPHMPYYRHDELKGTPFEDKRTYDAEIAFMDMQVRRLVAFLAEQDLQADTLVIAVGDHGEGLGEHNEVGHGYMLYDTTLAVPLVFSWPGQFQKGRRVASPVSLADLFPTILDIAHPSAASETAGRSLKPALVGQEIDDGLCYSESDFPFTNFGWSPLRSLTTRQWKYIRTARPELYDRLADPQESNNLIDRHPDVVANLEAELDALEASMVQHIAPKVDLAVKGKRNLEKLGYVDVTGHDTDTSTLDFASLRDIKDMLPVAKMEGAMKDLKRAGRIEQAIAMSRQMVQLSPESARLQNQLGKLLLGAGHADEAVAPLAEAVELDAKSYTARNDLGNAFLVLNQLPQALEQFTEAARLSPDNAEIKTNIGDTLLRQGHVDQAIEQCRKAVELKPHLAAAHHVLANALLAANQTDEAIEHLAEAARLEPDNIEIHLPLAMLFVQTGNLDGAISHFQRAAEIDPNDDQIFYSLGLAFLQKGDLDQGIASCRQAIRLNPNHVQAHVNLANALLTKELYDEAIIHCRRAIELDPDMLPAHYNLGLAKLAQNRIDEAIQHFRDAQRIAPENQLVQDQLQKALALKQATQPAS